MKIVLAFLCLFSTQLQAQTNFVDIAQTSGVFINPGSLEYGSGISFCDFNNDGWDDITLGTDSGRQIEFFSNDQDGTFTRQFFLTADPSSQDRQVIWVDYDNDGDKDLYIASDANGSHLYNNDGALNFTDVTAAAGLPVGNIYNWGVSWGDINNDGLLDVFISNRDDNLQQPNLLYQNNGDGTFTDISTQAGIHNTGHLSFCSAFFDYNNDGWQDIYVANDKIFNENFLYHNNGDGTFTNVAATANVNIAIDAMSTTIGDFNNDGWFDIYVSNTPINGNVFLKNNGDGTFSDVTNSTNTEFNGFSWGAVFLDADNDMNLDLYVSSSMDGSVPSLASAAFYHNNGNETFTIPEEGFQNDTRISHSNAIGDIDNDGYPEIIVNNTNNANMFLWKNQGDLSNNWLKVRLSGVQSNKDGIGSVIEISVDGNKQYRYTLCGEGYISQNSSAEFFGVGSYNVIDYVKITWLSGMVDYIENVNANQELLVVEGSNQLSVAEKHFSTSLSVYPNPTQDKLQIKNIENENVNVNIYNVLGSKMIHTIANKNESVIDVSSLASGIYFVRLTVEGSTQEFKIIKK
ncbi:FG-GAP-like repeat-containing protein [Corallibacter sp.]|uniref:FG-GAP-like repeat-containing protein n=1 Tax=Corallibacter sp. TaxID=2038084 RepID=UPI003A8FF833